MSKQISHLQSIERKDVVKNDKIDIVANTFIVRETDRIIFKPIDHTQVMLVDGIESTNSVIIKELSKVTDSSKTVTVITSNHSDNSVIKKDEKKTTKTTTLDRDSSFGIWGWFWIILVCGTVLWIVKTRLKLI
ncbi:hypothetical protein [Aquimarina sp. 2201CG5-10]|uniref:hypothetical protein n=1 Tax=Aquimarina callyspongiae TaxID=3098150 RepID=UPI002AB4C215|nr:hypothetical protein [Aquimarina sp. 2201CG5-10]MDY8137549.1 hypothetical protein [Aquimarina sp. 2201CG5-10]